MTERAFRFGRAQHLVGIAGLPEATTGDVGVIMLNAGLIHRIGPFRLHVELARQLNVCGYPTLRFDQSTLGDSGASSESQTLTQQVCADVGDAMALLKQHSGCTRVVLVGLCAGAQSAHTVARSDARVAGVIYLDGYAYRTPGYHLRHYLPRLFDAGRWWRALTRRRQPSPPRGAEPVFTVAWLPQATVHADFAGMLARGQKLYLIYTGGIGYCFNHARQFRECFGRLVSHPGMTTRYVGETDHTYILTGDRQRLIESIEQWLSRNFPVPAGTSP